MASNLRVRWIDMVKGFGIFLMVIGHASGLPENIKLWIYGFHMPLFFILSGYTYGMFDEKKFKNKGLYFIVKQKTKSYLKPYFILFFINLIIQTLFELLKYGGGGYELFKIRNYLVAGLYSHDTNMPNCAPLWFLTCLFVAYIFFWIMVNQEKFYKQILVAMIYFIILCFVLFIEKKYGIAQLPWHIDTALIASIFMLAGNFIYKFSPRISWLNQNIRVVIYICGFVISSIAFFFNGRIIMVINQYHNMILFFISATIMSVVIIEIINMYEKNSHNSRIINLFSWWGSNTLIFLGFNYVFNLVVSQALRLINLNGTIINTIIDIIVVMAGCSVIAFEWNRIKHSIKQRNM